MDRETFCIAGEKHSYQIKTYATARETSIIQQAYFKGSKVELVGGEPKVSEFNANVQYDVELEMIRQLVTEMDGTSEGIVERCEQLPNEEFRNLIDQLNELTGKKKK